MIPCHVCHNKEYNISDGESEHLKQEKLMFLRRLQDLRPGLRKLKRVLKVQIVRKLICEHLS